MADQDNIRVVREAFDAWNDHNVERQLKLLDEKHIAESDTIPQPAIGREAFRQFMQIYLVAFPDLHFALDPILASGDQGRSAGSAFATEISAGAGPGSLAEEGGVESAIADEGPGARDQGRASRRSYTAGLRASQARPILPHQGDGERGA